MVDQIMVILLIVCMFVLLVKNTYEPVIVFFVGGLILVIMGVISIDELLSGFSNQGVLTVAVLFVMAGTVQKSPYLYRLASLIFGSHGSERLTLAKIILPVTLFSAFLNNTPVVAIFIPMIRKWALKNKVSPSKLLIPLSYAAIIGGTLTLIGTSTNLVVSGLLEAHGYQGLGMFEMSKVSIFIGIIALLYLFFVVPRLLPNNADLLETTKRNYREYMIMMTVEKGCHIIGKPVSKAGLRNLEGVYLAEIIRKDRQIYPINPEKVIIQEGDELIFTGQIKTIASLQSIQGLRLQASHEEFTKELDHDKAQMVEVVVSDAFPFLNQTIKESNFRAKYDAAVVAVMRKGKRINGKIGQIRLRTGDTLLMLTSKDFYHTWGVSKDFYIISEHVSLYKLPKKNQLLSLGIFLGTILLAAFGILPIVYASLLGVAVLFVTKEVRSKEAWKYINWDTIVTIALSFGVGKALINSGAADTVASVFLETMLPFGPMGVLAAIFLMTNIFTEVITNNAAAVLAFPIAITVAQQMGLDPRPFVIAVAIGASTSFASPIGYQTNMMVYGPGGYKFGDFMKVGLPLDLIYFVGSVVLIPIFFPF